MKPVDIEYNDFLKINNYLKINKNLFLTTHETCKKTHIKNRLDIVY